MINARKGILRSSLIAALGVTAVAGCASNKDADERFASNCDPAVTAQMAELNDALNEAVRSRKAEWTPTEARAIQEELGLAMTDCDPGSSSELITRAENELSKIEKKEADAERQREEERLAQERADKENQRYLEMAKEEWNQVEKYENLNDEQLELKSEGKTALDEEEGRRSYNLLSSLNADLKDRMEEYVVKDGDTLWDIAASSQVYDNPWQWPAIHDENMDKIEDPNLIYPGQKLMIDKNAQPTQLTAQAKRNNLM